MEKLYEIKKLEAQPIDIPTYLDEYVDIPTFLECCKACPNFGTTWSCPPYDFDVEAFWNRYSTLKLYGTQLIYTEEAVNRRYTKEEADRILEETLKPEKLALSKEMEVLEKQNPGSQALSAGSCILCKDCARTQGNPCRHPDSMRYSIESLGGNVGKTTSRLLGIELEWMEENRLPHYFTLINGLLLP